MSYRVFTTTRSVALAIAAVASLAVAACSNDAAPPTLPIVTQQSGAVTTGGTDTANTPAPPTSNGPVASVQVVPHTLMMSQGRYATLAGIALDAGGVRVIGKTAAWRAADANVVVMSDTGLAFGKSVGTTKVYATIDGHTDSATVTVIAGADSIPTYTPPPPAVASFDLAVTIYGAVAGSDTSKVALVPGATVTLTRVGGIHGDTLAAPINAGSATTGANGVASFTKLDGGYYSLDVAPPAGSTFLPLHGGFGAPTTSAVAVRYTLHRN